MKTGLSKDMVAYLIKDEDVDIISFVPHIPNYLQWTEKQHSGFMLRFNLLCNHLGLEVKEPACVIYSNFFVAKEDVYRRYVREIIKPGIDFMEKNKELYYADANYKSGLLADKLKQFTGLDHYPFTTFVLERLISVVIDNWNLSWKTKTKIL